MVYQSVVSYFLRIRERKEEKNPDSILKEKKNGTGHQSLWYQRRENKKKKKRKGLSNARKRLYTYVHINGFQTPPEEESKNFIISMCGLNSCCVRD